MDRKLPTSAEPLLAELLEIIELSTPLRWETARVSVQSTVLTSMWSLSVVTEDGTTKPATLQKAFSPKLAEFRGACYEEGRGTWYSAAITLHKGGEPDVRLYYDEKPEWRRGAWPHPGTYVRDLEFFPRDEEHMPDWLREQVDLAAEAETSGWQDER